jgi:hypothetical protein
LTGTKGRREKTLTGTKRRKVENIGCKCTVECKKKLTRTKRQTIKTSTGIKVEWKNVNRDER